MAHWLVGEEHVHDRYPSQMISSSSLCRSLSHLLIAPRLATLPDYDDSNAVTFDCMSDTLRLSNSTCFSTPRSVNHSRDSEMNSDTTNREQ